jgi:acetyltransferase-like isoleucine patch superfamily enzyme
MLKATFKDLVLIFHFPFSIIRKIYCKLRSVYYSFYIDQGSGKIIISDPFLSFKIVKAEGARLIINGIFRVTPHLGGTTPIRIVLGPNSRLIIDGDFLIGHGVRFSLHYNATLYIGGKKSETSSGITAETLIMVYNKITIGKDFVCAWDVFISDSDWHLIENQDHHSDIEIGEHVWVANNCSILKGCKINSGSIIASFSKLINHEYPSRSIIAGVPAKVIKSNINWSRDLD